MAHGGWGDWTGAGDPVYSRGIDDIPVGHFVPLLEFNLGVKEVVALADCASEQDVRRAGALRIPTVSLNKDVAKDAWHGGDIRTATCGDFEAGCVGDEESVILQLFGKDIDVVTGTEQASAFQTQLYKLIIGSWTPGPIIHAGACWRGFVANLYSRSGIPRSSCRHVWAPRG